MNALLASGGYPWTIITFKESFSIFKNKTLDFLKLNLPPITDFVRTEFCEIETHDTIRFAMYDLQILK